MNLNLQAAMQVIRLATRLFDIAETGGNMIFGQKETVDCQLWQEISHIAAIAAENAAKPEIQGNAEH